MRKLLLLTLFCVAGCAQPMVWDKPGATQVNFNQDDYACQKDAIAYGGVAYVGWGVTNRTPNRNIYMRCMAAHGYTLEKRG